MSHQSRECNTCGNIFEPKRDWQIYCSDKCRHNSPRKRVTTRDYSASRRELINRIKVERGCSICGFSEHPAALQFNHIKGEKLFTISQDPKRSWKAIEEEIEKCEVLCANCHAIHTHTENHYWTKRKTTEQSSSILRQMDS